MFKEIHIENNYKNLGGGELNEANSGDKIQIKNVKLIVTLQSNRKRKNVIRICK